MCQIRHTDSDNVSPIRAMHSLSETQAISITASLRGFAKSWSVERHECCDGHLSLLLSDNADTCLIVDRDASGIRISRMHGDSWHPGERRHNSADEVVEALKGMTETDRAGSRRRLA